MIYDNRNIDVLRNLLLYHIVNGTANVTQTSNVVNTLATVDLAQAITNDTYMNTNVITSLYGLLNINNRSYYIDNSTLAVQELLVYNSTATVNTQYGNVTGLFNTNFTSMVC